MFLIMLISISQVSIFEKLNSKKTQLIEFSTRHNNNSFKTYNADVIVHKISSFYKYFMIYF